mmetsp:Transcript_482/g.959  ORF Transcript_482/g.959 Transcript_482/m.959 type:complete len:211 (+) Transcript_482:697-1329(+)
MRTYIHRASFGPWSPNTCSGHAWQHTPPACPAAAGPTSPAPAPRVEPSHNKRVWSWVSSIPARVYRVDECTRCGRPASLPDLPTASEPLFPPPPHACHSSRHIPSPSHSHTYTHATHRQTLVHDPCGPALESTNVTPFGSACRESFPKRRLSSTCLGKRRARVHYLSHSDHEPPVHTYPGLGVCMALRLSIVKSANLCNLYSRLQCRIGL